MDLGQYLSESFTDENLDYCDKVYSSSFRTKEMSVLQFAKEFYCGDIEEAIESIKHELGEKYSESAIVCSIVNHKGEGEYDVALYSDCKELPLFISKHEYLF